MAKSKMKLGYSFVPLPQNIWDDGIDLSLVGFRLLGWLIRHSVRIGQPIVILTDDEALNGRIRGGKRVCKGAGVPRNGLKDAREELSSLGWVDSSQVKGARGVWQYVVNVDSDDDAAQVSQFDTQPDDKCHVSTVECQASTDKCHASTLGISDNPVSNEAFTLEPESPRAFKSIKKEKKVTDSSVDVRHSQTRVAIMNAYHAANNAQCPWSAACAGALSTFLSSVPDWDMATIQRCIDNRFMSEMPRSASPHTWLARLAEYLDSPLDRYFKPIGGNRAATKQSQSFAAIDAAGRAQGSRHQLGGGNNGRTFRSLPSSTRIDR